ncbi:ATP-binding cassette domain-containing protein [Nonomuraea aurantiaca]|uniref:ATP-binding cassette domain-containing protein n=1 Tax=Nonomuraea aurantiaca TaxID=2878562 RepID=UPI001CD9DF9C|nr:ABC transporter ATP-binding protein [Nonomuraea aurantiaca]MCA2230235.1 ABC transporter ATP-binding protein/permease [Nonomuraea aurantiaca]
MLAAERRSLVVLCGWSVLEIVPILTSGQLVALAVDHGFLAGQLDLGLLVLACYGCALLLGAVGARQTMRPLAVLVESVRDRLVYSVVAGTLHNAVRVSTDADTGAVSRMTRQTEGVRQTVAVLLLVVRTIAFSIAAVLIGLTTLAPLLAWVTGAALAFALMLLALLSRVLRRRYLASMLAEERFSEESSQVLAGLRDVAACGAYETATSQIGVAADRQAATAMATARTGAGRIMIIALGARLPLLFALAAAPWLVSSGAVTPGEILGAATYLVAGLEPALRSIVGTIGNLGLQLGVSLDRLAAAANVPPEAQALSRTASTFDIELTSVAFAYGPHSEPIVEGLDLQVEHGEHLAIVGPSGIGKSTVAALLAGLETPQKGVAQMGGVPLTELCPQWLRRTVALVPQESYVFCGTVRDNLRYLAPAATDGQLDAAVDQLGLRELVGQLGGYDAEIEHIDSLSQGERQLITLARVFLSGAEVVILDEATCHLDSRAEAVVERAFARRSGTLIVIAHRISSAARARRILVLDGIDARIGSHETLLGSSALYADLAGLWTAP